MNELEMKRLVRDVTQLSLDYAALVHLALTGVRPTPALRQRKADLDTRRSVLAQRSLDVIQNAPPSDMQRALIVHLVALTAPPDGRR